MLLHVRLTMVAVGMTSSAGYNSTTIAGVTLHLANTQSAPMPLMVRSKYVPNRAHFGKLHVRI